MIWLVVALVVGALVIIGCARKRASDRADLTSGAGTSATASVTAASPATSQSAGFSTTKIQLKTLGFPVALEREFRVSLFGVVDEKLDPNKVIGLLERAGRSAGISRGETSIDDEDPKAPIYMTDLRAPKRKLGAEGELAPVFALSISAAKLGQGHRFDDAARLAKVWIAVLGADGDPNAKLESFTHALDAVGASPQAPILVLSSSPKDVQCKEKRPIFCTRRDEEGAKRVLLQLLQWLDTAT